MASAKRLCVFAIAWLTAVSAFSTSYTPHNRGSKLFGGYRIVPKVCQPTNPSMLKSNEPATCMFNHECVKRNGEVVGACMDGFLFGACCRLPPGDPQAITAIQANLSPITESSSSVHGIGRVPADGTPSGTSSSDLAGITKISIHKTSNHPGNSAGSYMKISTFSPNRSTQRPSTGSSPSADVAENAEKPQIPAVTNVSQFEADITALLEQQELLDDLRLPVLITNSDSNNDIRDHQESSGINPVTTLLSADQIFQIADPVDQLPALFSQGLGQNNHSGAETVLLNKNGTYLEENNNPDEHFKPGAGSSTTDTNDHADSHTQATSSIHEYSQFYDKASTPTIQQYANMHILTGSTSEIKYTSAVPGLTQSRIPTKTTNFLQSSSLDEQDPHSKTTMLQIDITTPMSSTYVNDDDLVRVPTITYDAQSGNKKHDGLDPQEIAVNQIISMLNATTPTSHTKITQPIPHSPSTIHTWTNVDYTTKSGTTRIPGPEPSTTTETFPYTFYRPGKPTTYYHYDTASTSPFGGSSSFSTSSSSSASSDHYISRKPPVTSGSYGSSNGYDYSTRPSTNPPAPTVIVLGPLGTEFTTVTTEKPASRRPTPTPIKPSSDTKQPSIGTTITHNISTVISTNSAATSNNHVVSTSYVSVHLKDSTSPKPTGSVSAQATVVPNSGITNNRVVTKRPSTVWTTLSPWSDKPSFHLKPSKPDFTWPNGNIIHTVIFKETTVAGKPVAVDSTTTSTVPKTTTPTTTISDDETPPPDALINFPPVRNPNLTQQEKPTIVQTFNDTDLLGIDHLNEDEIPTPAFIEDDILTNKVDVFVNKIVQSLQGNFQDLKDVVYSKKNTTVPPPATSVITKKPPTRKPAKPTAAKPSSQTTKRPVTKKPSRPSGATQKPGGSTSPVRPSKPTSPKPRPTSTISTPTKKPQTTPPKRKPTKKPTAATTPTTTTTSVSDVSIQNSEDSTGEQPDVPTGAEDISQDFRTQCGIRPALKTGRIVGGKGATFGEWPWQVLVREATWLGLFTKNKCGGVLITKKYVTTAAHCQPGFLATLVAVFGEFDISGELEPKPSVTKNVKRIIVHREYDPATFRNDIALLELESPIAFDAHIVPICLPANGADFTGRMATVTGWGRVKYNGGTPSVLQEVQVPIMENAVCQEMFKTAGHSKRILDSFLCAGYASGQKDSCEGDSGGPLMIQESDGRWVLVGTVSHGIKCATPYLPGVYMRATFFKPWLHGVTGV